MTDAVVFQLEEALDRAGQDWDLFRMISELFFDMGPQDLAAIKGALGAGDAAAAAQSAHHLKGAVLQFCAPAALEATKTVERLAKAGELAEATQACMRLEAELLRLSASIRHAMEKGAPA